MAPTPTMEPMNGDDEWRRMAREHPVMRMSRNDKEVGMDYVNIPHVVAMVGLPARGKTYIAMKLARYLNWVGLPTKVFNVGDYRRQAIGTYQGHDFFHPRNRDGTNIRNKCALDALQDVCEFLQSGGMVAVYDATNTNIERRELIHHVVCHRMGYKLFFIESICNDPAIIETNIMECKVTNPDYTNMEKEDAVKDFLKRIEHYRTLYEPLDEEKEPQFSFMKIFDAGRRVVVHKQEGHIESRIAYYLMNIHITPRSIYITRHGESVYNQLGRIGGDTDLSHRGRQYANALAKFITSQTIPNLRVWTSCMKRTVQTASGISAPQERWKALNEIDAGICEGLMYEEIQEQYPEEFAARDQNKYSYRYPRGESYEDVVVRLESVIMELERQENVLVVGHQAVLRCVLAYFLNKTGVELPYLKVPLHTIIKLTPQAYGCKVEFFKIPIDCVDTHRSKPIMANQLPARIIREALTKPWVKLRVFQNEGIISRLPEHYKKFYWDWKFGPKTPVHYIPKQGNFEKLACGSVVPVQDQPILLMQPKQLHQGIWGGEAVIKGFRKKKPTKRRVPRYWVPTLEKTVVYSEILDRYINLTVTERTLCLIDKHYGFDNYILQTTSADLMSELALQLKREMLLTLCRGTLYPDDPAKREEVTEKYHQYMVPEEEADWYGLTLKEATIKQKILEDAADTPKPLKHAFRIEFIEHLKAKQEDQKLQGESSEDSNWLSRMNPFAKK